jgi:hypothetical protein
MEVICLDTKAFYALVDEVIEHVKETQQDDKPDKWISGEEAMRLLRITSKTTLSYMRNQGKIRYSQPEKKIILYDRDSIDEYLEKHAKDTF